MMTIVSPVLVVPVAMAAAVQVPASAHAAAMAVPVVLVVLQDVTRMKVQTLAFLVVLVLLVIPQAPWVCSIFSKLSL